MSDHPTEASQPFVGSPPRPSASLILLRTARSGLEVFMVRRPERAHSFAAANVFPGGSVHPDDLADRTERTDFTGATALAELTVRGGESPSGPTEALALWRAALRELFEEAGVLLAADGRGQTIAFDDGNRERWQDYRRQLLADTVRFSEILRREVLALQYNRLVYFSHWITPLVIPRRFDTRFFVAELPPGQEASHDGRELTDGVWIRPREALDLFAQGRFELVHPTRLHLERLAGFGSAAAVLAYARQKLIRTVLPTLESEGGVERVALAEGVIEW